MQRTLVFPLNRGAPRTLGVAGRGWLAPEQKIFRFNHSQQDQRLREISKMSSFVIISCPVENFQNVIIRYHFRFGERPRPPGGRPDRAYIHASKRVARMGSLPSLSPLPFQSAMRGTQSRPGFIGCDRAFAPDDSANPAIGAASHKSERATAAAPLRGRGLIVEHRKRDRLAEQEGWRCAR